MTSTLAASPNRRHVLYRLGRLGALGLLPGAAALPRARAAAGDGYRALVCIDLEGGNDGNNLLVPTDAPRYAQYLDARGGRAGTVDNGALALAEAGENGGLLPLEGSGYGVHPAMPEIAALWRQGRVAWVCNTGNLVRPFEGAAAFRANRDASRVPAHLFSHSDQVRHLQVGSATGAPAGWVGRMADALDVPPGGLPATVSTAGNALMLAGGSSMPLVVPAAGAADYRIVSTDTLAQTRLQALKSLFAGNHAELVASLGQTQDAGVRTADLLASLLSPEAQAGMATHFADGGRSTLSRQLVDVALLIQAAVRGDVVAPARQVFFVQLGGFDTHQGQLRRQALLLRELSQGLHGFLRAMTSLGRADQVVAFTQSEFGRTLLPTSGGGSDHGWGSHQLVVGGVGAIRPGVYGQFPELVLGGPDDVSARGRWLPTTSNDQYAATLGAWLGADAATLDAALPRLGRYGTRDLGFLRSPGSAAG
jgi:uncharacterized protein (DUF1501 family)